jgi:trehalose synthase
MQEINIPALPPERFDPLLGERAAAWSHTLAQARKALGGRTLWHVNSTSKGGGVAEMLQSVLCYLVGAGINTRWLVIGGNDDFFDLTKQNHFLLHGAPGEMTELGPSARATYESALESESTDILDLVRPGDVVILRDPQTVGLAPALRAGALSVLASRVSLTTC